MVAQVEQAGFNRFLFVTSRLQRQLQGLVQATRRSNRPVDSKQFGQILPPEAWLGATESPTWNRRNSVVSPAPQ